MIFFRISDKKRTRSTTITNKRVLMTEGGFVEQEYIQSFFSVCVSMWWQKYRGFAIIELTLDRILKITNTFRYIKTVKIRSQQFKFASEKIHKIYYNRANCWCCCFVFSVPRFVEILLDLRCAMFDASYIICGMAVSSQLRFRTTAQLK